MLKISEDDLQIVIGALDSLGVALAGHDHNWSVGERTIYEESVIVLTNDIHQPDVLRNV